jgi:hypothetical protein
MCTILSVRSCPLFSCRRWAREILLLYALLLLKLSSSTISYPVGHHQSRTFRTENNNTLWVSYFWSFVLFHMPYENACKQFSFCALCSLLCLRLRMAELCLCDDDKLLSLLLLSCGISLISY